MMLVSSADASSFPAWPDPSQVEPGPFVGQLVLLPEDPAAAAVAAGGAAVAAALAGLPSSGAAAAAGVARRLSDAQFEAHLEAEQGQVQQSRAAIDLLRTAQEALLGSGEAGVKETHTCLPAAPCGPGRGGASVVVLTSSRPCLC